MSNITYHTPDEAEKAIATYDWQLVKCIRMIQAFINHERNPGFFGLPSIEDAEACWREAVRVAGDIRGNEETYLVGKPKAKTVREIRYATLLGAVIDLNDSRFTESFTLDLTDNPCIAVLVNEHFAAKEGG